MSRNIKTAAVFIAIVSIALPFAANPKKRSETRNQRNETPQNAPKVLWRKPADISARDLFYGPGGKEDQPGTTCTFIKEDLKGSHPKFDVRDQNGVKWRAKLGAEARPEMVASRLVWAVGYYTNEDYFLPVLRVRNMPRLQRGQNLVSPDGSITNLRLKRYLKGEKKIALWRWHRNPFVGTRELNGLRVMMALINNWDLKDDNNSVYEEQAGAGSRKSSLRSTKICYLRWELVACPQYYGHLNGEKSMGESRILTLDSEEIVYGEHTTRNVRLAAAVLNADSASCFRWRADCRVQQRHTCQCHEIPTGDNQTNQPCEGRGGATPNTLCHSA